MVTAKRRYHSRRELNTDGIPCPSAADPNRNSHRRQDGWQVATISTILRNVTYTGFRVWGAVRKVERLVDPDTPALGHRYLREGIWRCRRSDRRYPRTSP
jgi:site-specific DNA recombinase